MYEACDWPIAYKDCPPGVRDTPCSTLEKLSDDDRERVEKLAVDYLWNFTNRVFGLCTVELRPCKQGVNRLTDTFWGRGPFPMRGDGVGGYTGWFPALIGGLWFNVGCGTCTDACSCAPDSTRSLALPGPVHSIERVRVDGVTLPQSAYRVDFGRYLIRQDGGAWPQGQDLTLSASEEGTFEIVYRRGVEVPVGGQFAAGLLAVEFGKAICGDNSCALPRRIKSITRQEVTVDLMDDFSDLKEGMTGIWLVDNWIRQVTQPRPYSSVRSVDVKRGPGAYRVR